MVAPSCTTQSIVYCSNDTIGYLYVGAKTIIKRDPSGLYTIPDAENDYCNLDGPCTSYVGTEKTDCFRDCLQNRKEEIFERWVEMEKDLGDWWADLPPCPTRLCFKKEYGFISVANPFPDFGMPEKMGFHEGRFHPWPAYISMRSKTVHGHSNQCIYDKWGNLVTTPPSHGRRSESTCGGPWPFGAPMSPQVQYDVNPVIYAAKLDGCWVSAWHGFGRIREGCMGPNLAKYFTVRPLWKDGGKAPNKQQCCNVKKWSFIGRQPTRD